jgi:hypothetical protein
MAIFTVTSNAVENVDIMISTSFKAGMALMRDDNGRGVPADSQLLVFKTLEQKAGKFLGFATSDHSAYSNTIIIPDVIGSSYIDSSYNYIRTENNEIAISKRGLVDNLNEGTPNLYNPSDKNVISRRGLAVYNQPNNIFITDQFKPVLHGDYGLDGLDTVALNPGDLLTFGGGVNAGKLVKVHVNSLGPDVLAVAIVEKYIVETGLLHFRQVSYGLSFGNSIMMYVDAANKASYPGTGNTWYDLSGNGNHLTLANGVSYSEVNSGVLQLDGSNDYIERSSFNISTTDHTIIGASRYSGAIQGRIFAGSNNWALGHLNSNPSYYAENYVYRTYGSNTNWQISIGIENYSSDLWTFIVNGNSLVTNNIGTSGPNGLSFGYYHNGGLGSEMSKAEIGFFIVYNRVLTTTEAINQYNFHKSRFGL